MAQGRTDKSIKNIKFAVIGQAFALVISFVTRYVFVRTLSVEYLGIEGLFSNILSLLSLADLGIGTAVIFSLYKPLAENDEAKICTLMHLYKRVFHIIGAVILLMGVALTPFFDYLIKEMPDIPYLKGIFVMFVVNTAIPYFFAERRSLLIADQKRYLTSIYRYSFYFALNVLQIIILFTTKNYYLFLGLLLLFTFLENFFLYKKTQQQYSYILKSKSYELSKDEKDVIIKNVKGMSFHRLGGVVVSGSDNILLSKIVGIVQVGLYSNYFLIINALTIVFSMLFQSITASIGNLVVTEDHKKSIQFFDILNFACFWIYGVISIVLFEVINPFISIWIGEDYLLNKSIVFVIVFNFFLQGMRKSVLTFRDALGLYWHDRYKPVFEAIINISASIFLGLKFGTLGIFIGTAISTLSTCFWVEPYVLFKYGLKTRLRHYFLDYLKYFMVVAIAFVITHYTLLSIDCTSILVFIIKTIICILIPSILFLLVFGRNVNFVFLLNILKSKIPLFNAKKS